MQEVTIKLKVSPNGEIEVVDNDKPKLPNITIKDMISPYADKSRNYYGLLQKISPTIGNKIIWEVTNEDICSFVEYCKQRGNINSTIHTNLRALRARWYDIAKLHKVTIKNPFSKPEQHAVPEPTQKKAFSINEAKRLESVKLPKKWELTRIMFLFSIYTGLRFSDLVLLKKTNIKNDRIVLQQKKGGRRHTIPLCEKAKDIITQCIEKNRLLVFNNAPLIGDFPPEVLKRKIESLNASYNTKINKIAALIGISRRISFHDARATCAVFMERHGGTSAAQIMLDHKSLKTTQCYLNKRSIEDLAAIANQASKF